MIIIKYLGKNIKQYLRYYQDVPPAIEASCPCCDNKLHRHGFYVRTVVTKCSVYHIPIYRWICSSCSKTISLLPDFLSPYKVFIGWIQESLFYRHFVRGESYSTIHPSLVLQQAGSISFRTLKRWCADWKMRIESSFQTLTKRILDYDPLSKPHVFIRSFNPYEGFSELIQYLWKKIHPSIPYPFYGFLPWINQLI